MKLKRFFFMVLLFDTLIISSCEKNEENTFMSAGKIIGPDIRECICCGGYFIEIDDSTYNFETLPENSKINLNTESFPLSVNLDWTYDKMCGGIQYIDILNIVKE